MISLQLIVPLAITAALAVVSTAAHRRLTPAQAAPLLTATIAAVALAVVPALAVIAFSYLAHQSSFGGVLQWCRDAIGVHAVVPRWLGLPAVSLLVLAVVRTRSVVRSWRMFRRVTAADPEVVASDAWFAYTLPGPGGQIVLSSGLIASLEPRELTVVLSHERAHARHRHDRHVLLAEVAAALVPLVRPLQRRLLFALERSADEAAVAAVDGDRAVVARTLARVALSQAPGPAPASGLAGLGVAARVEALSNPPTLQRARSWAVATAVGLVAVSAAAVVQVHHLGQLLIALCPG